MDPGGGISRITELFEETVQRIVVADIAATTPRQFQCARDIADTVADLQVVNMKALIDRTAVNTDLPISAAGKFNLLCV
jgi:hypothetical protein